MYDLFHTEASCLKKFNHPNILRVHKDSDKAYATKRSGKSVEVMYLALEYATNGEIFDYIAETGSFSEHIARYYFHQLISALEYMHSMGYYHRDIKPENILLDENFNLKLADFGFTTSHKVSTSRKGTFGYMAPEVLAKKEYNGAQADLFASAVILFILLSQHPPFIRAEETDRYYKKIYQGKWSKFWDTYADEGFSESFKDLFCKMVHPNPERRLTLQQIKEHEWFLGPVATHQEILSNFAVRKKVLQKHKEDKKKPKQKEKFDASNASTSAGKDSNKKRKATRRKQNKKYTRFYAVKNGDDLIDAVIKVSQQQSYKYKKSEDFFRVDITVTDDNDDEADITINVLKAPDEQMRCLEFIRVNGSRSLYESTFTVFKRYCKKKFGSARNH